MIQRIKSAWKVLTGELRYDQRTVTIEDISKRLRDLAKQYYKDNDLYTIVKIEFAYMHNTNTQTVIYQLYTNLPMPQHITSKNLDEAFSLMEKYLSKEPQVGITDEIKVEI